MALFGKPKKAAEQKDGDSAAKQPPRKKKKNELLSSVLDESVPEQVVSEMQANTVCVVENNDGETLFAGMLLDTEAIGGLNKKALRDEDRGQVIEQIQSGRIKAYVPAELMAEDKIVFVPTLQSMDAMSEYGLLTAAPYTVALTEVGGHVRDTGVACTFDNFKNALESDSDDAVIDMLEDLGVEGFESMGDEDDGFDPALTQPMPAHMADSEPEDDGVPVFEDDEPPVFDDEPDDIPVFEDEPAPYGEPAPVAAPAPEPEPEVEPEPAPEPEPEVEVDQATLDAAIVRKFYSDDLGLEVSTEAFDAQFIHANPFVPFAEERGDGWLDGYVSNMSREANTELRRLRTQQLQNCKETFYNLVAIHCETITQALDVNDPDTQFGQLANALIENRNMQLAQVDELVSRRRDEINDEFDKNVKMVSDDAARAAAATYRERHGRAKDEKLFALEADVRRDIENEYQDAVRDMNAERRKDAAKRLDAGIMEALREVSDIWKGNVAEQDELYRSYRDKIAAFIDDNRKQDIAHDQALAEELTQKTKADKVMDEYRIKMQNQAASYDEQLKKLRAEIADNERAAKLRTQEVQAEADKRVSLLTQEKATMQRRYDELTDKYADLDASKEAKYEQQMNQLRGENSAWNDKFEQLQSEHKKSSALIVALTVVSVIAALAIGTLIGTNLDLGFGSDKAASESIDAVQKQLDELEEKYDAEKLSNEKLKSENETLKSQQTQAQTPAAETAPVAETEAE